VFEGYGPKVELVGGAVAQQNTQCRPSIVHPANHLTPHTASLYAPIVPSLPAPVQSAVGHQGVPRQHQDVSTHLAKC